MLNHRNTASWLIEELYKVEYDKRTFQRHKDLIISAELQKRKMDDLTIDEWFSLAVSCFVVYTQSRDNAGEFWGGEDRFPSDDAYLRTVDRLGEVADRLEGLTVIHADFFDLIKLPQFNRPDVVFYLDPPYLAAEDREDKRNPGLYYRHRFEVAQHKKLLEWARTTKSRVLISGYTDAERLYDKYLCDGEGLRGNAKRRFIPWSRFEFESRSVVSKYDGRRTEVIWSNHASIGI